MPTPRRSWPWSLTALVAVLALASLHGAHAQEELQLDDLGNTIAVSIVTDAAGDPVETLVLSTLSTDAAAAGTDTATSTAPTATATTTTDPDPVNVGQPAVDLTPSSRCTTAGCPVAPTTYTQSGVIVTWYATTPATPVPQVTSSGQILDVGNYISSVSTATGQQGAATAGTNAVSGAAASSMRLPWRTNTGDWAVMAGVALVGGLVGAVALL